MQEIRAQRLPVDAPIPIAERAEFLLDALFEKGYGTISRGVLVSALIRHAPEDPAELFKLIQAYRISTVREVTPGEAGTGELLPDNVIEFPGQRKSGPRSRAAET